MWTSLKIGMPVDGACCCWLCLFLFDVMKIEPGENIDMDGSNGNLDLYGSHIGLVEFWNPPHNSFIRGITPISPKYGMMCCAG